MTVLANSQIFIERPRVHAPARCDKQYRNLSMENVKAPPLRHFHPPLKNHCLLFGVYPLTLFFGSPKF